jgi:hypothetical protein
VNNFFSKELLNLIVFFLFLSTIVNSQGLELPFQSRFDSSKEREFWKEYRTGKKHQNNWTFSTSLASSKPFCLFHDYPNTVTKLDTIHDWLVSPPLNLSKETVFKFQLILFCAGGKPDFMDYFGIWVGKKNSNPKFGEYREIANLSRFAQNNSKWNDVNFLVPPLGDSIYIAFVYKCTNNWLTVNIDNFEIITRDFELKEYKLVNSLITFGSTQSINDNFALPSTENKFCFLNLYDQQGKCIHTQKIKKGKNYFSNKKIEPGLYEIKVMDNFGEILQKQNIVLTK